MEEARAAGVADIIDLELPTENDLEKELLYLEREQEKLIAELRKSYQDQMDAENDARKGDFDKEMERRAKEMNILNQAGAAEQLNELQNVSTYINILISTYNLFYWLLFFRKTFYKSLAQNVGFLNIPKDSYVYYFFVLFLFSIINHILCSFPARIDG